MDANATLAESLIDDQFQRQGNDLLIGNVALRDLAREYGTPFFVYDASILRNQYRSLHDAIAPFAEIFFSIKANPNIEIIRVFLAEGSGLEIASIGEFKRALEAGGTPENTLFAGPGKGTAELDEAIGSGIGEIHLESIEELRLVAFHARKHGLIQPVAIRVNPIAAVQGGAMRMGGKPAAFGFDEEILPEIVATVLQEPSLALTGVHLFSGTQILDADVLLRQWHHGLQIASAIAKLAGRRLETIDLGGGLGVPYHTGDEAIDLARIKRSIKDLMAFQRGDPGISNARVIVEPGRYLTATAGIYGMMVRSVKQSRGQRFVVCDGGMHHHLAASGNLGQVIKRDYPLLAATRLQASKREPAMVVGPLCTPLDALGRQTQMPELAEGDLIAVLQSGAYGPSASPVGFLSHPPAREIMVDNGRHWAIDIKQW